MGQGWWRLGTARGVGGITFLPSSLQHLQEAQPRRASRSPAPSCGTGPGVQVSIPLSCPMEMSLLSRLWLISVSW